MKLNSLEDKIRQYLNTNYGIKEKIIDKIQVLAHDIAEICEGDFWTTKIREVEQLEKENANQVKGINRLNGKIADLKKTIKYLDGISMLNSDLIKENDKLKLDLTIKAEYIEELKNQYLALVEIM